MSNPWDYPMSMRLKPRPRLTARIRVRVTSLGTAVLYTLGEWEWRLDEEGWVRCSACRGVNCAVRLGELTNIQHGCGPLQETLKAWQSAGASA